MADPLRAEIFVQAIFALGIFYDEPGPLNPARVLEYAALSGQECPLYTTAAEARPKLRDVDLLVFRLWIALGVGFGFFIIPIVGRITGLFDQASPLQGAIVFRPRMAVVIGRDFAIEPGGIHRVDEDRKSTR